MADQTIFLGPQDVIGAALLKRAQRDAAFRAELARDPQTAVARALGLLLPDRLRIHVQMEAVAAQRGVMPRPVAVAVPA